MADAVDLRRVAKKASAGDAASLGLQLRLESIVAAATAWDDSGLAYDTGVVCGRARGRARCRGCLTVSRDVVRAEVRWRCARCGDEGAIVNWADTDGDLREEWPIPPWAVEPVPGKPDEYLRILVDRSELRFLQRSARADEGEHWLFLHAARRVGTRFLLVGPDVHWREVELFLREEEMSGSRDAECARRVRGRYARAWRVSRERQKADVRRKPRPRIAELGEGPLRN